MNVQIVAVAGAGRHVFRLAFDGAGDGLVCKLRRVIGKLCTAVRRRFR